MELINFTRL